MRESTPTRIWWGARHDDLSNNQYNIIFISVHFILNCVCAFVRASRVYDSF